MAVILGLDSEVWTVIASLALVAATSALATATYFLGKSSRTHEKLVQAQTAAIETQTKSIQTQTATLVRPTIGLYEANRLSSTMATVEVRNNGLGPASFTMRISSTGWSVELPLDGKTAYHLAREERREIIFEIPATITEIDVEITYTDILRTNYSLSLGHRPVFPVEGQMQSGDSRPT